MRLRIPPGRAGRPWLRDRIAAAHRAADLLDRKRRELESERHRLGTIVGRREREWRSTMATCGHWLGRVDATAGDRALQMAVALEPACAQITVDWRQVMGVHYPIDVHVQLPDAPHIALLDGGAALAFAIDVYGRAVRAAMAHAVARTAETRIRAELDRTVRRLRALRLRAIPAHEDALRALELRLDEKDREDAVAARWASTAASTAVGQHAALAGATPASRAGP